MNGTGAAPLAGFAAQAARWVERSGGDRAASLAAAGFAQRIELALAQGHACLSLSDNEQAEALACGVTGSTLAPAAFPLLLDPQGRLYLHRYFDYERRLAGDLLRLDADLPVAETAARVEALLLQLFPAPADGLPDRQREAVQGALRRRFTLISGGPGTGKTSTVVRLLACLLAGDPGLRIRLAAPTGKAAARMQEALRARAGTVPADLQAGLTLQATTVHRLLGHDPQRGFRHHADDPLPLDVLVVDEASMLDLALAAHLLAALPAHARLVLLGDRDQLAAVESGAVFAELALQTGADALIGGVVALERQFRFAHDSGIGALASAIRDGKVEDAWAQLAHGAGLAFLPLPDGTGRVPAAELLARLADDFQPYWRALDERDDPAGVFAALNGFRVLCALRAGPWGAEAIAGWLDAYARRRLEGPAGLALDSAWYRGRPVMILRNDPVLQLFNGDIGIALPDADGELQVAFQSADGSLRWIAPVRLPPHEPAFAMTVHKSQGSEFDAVAVVLSPEANPLLTRELLYTAVTRARSRVLLLAAARRVAEAIGNPTRRDSGLLDRLREARGAARERADRPVVGPELAAVAPPLTPVHKAR